MDVGIVLAPTPPWPVFIGSVCWAERVGASHVWIFDHLKWRNAPSAGWLGAMPVLGAIAHATSSVRFGPLVSSANLRTAISFAKDLATLDHLSDGRVIAGVGAGVSGFDADAMAEHLAGTRFERFERLVADLAVLLGPNRREHAFGDMAPGPVGDCIPLAVAATRERGMELAVRHAHYWVTNGFSASPGREGPVVEIDEFKDQANSIDRLCDLVGRLPRTLNRIAIVGSPAGSTELSSIQLVELLAELRDLGFTCAGIPLPMSPSVADYDALESVLQIFNYSKEK